MVPTELAAKLASNQVILFVGAGASKSLGLPTYPELMREIGGLLDFDGELFHGFGDYLTLAEFYHLQRKGLSELQTYLRSKWRRSRAEIMESDVHRAIVGLDCSLIYTTNFDGFLEQAHREMRRRYRTIRSVKDLVDSKPDHVQIVKLHGDLSNPSTLVFTESSYFERLSFEAPLDVKLRADALGKALLFIGYSLSDINIRYLLFRLQKQWESEPKREMRPKSYLFVGRPNPIQEAVLRSRGIEPIIAEDGDPGESLAGFLTSLRSAANALHNKVS
jgi:hypothetical protein